MPLLPPAALNGGRGVAGMHDATTSLTLFNIYKQNEEEDEHLIPQGAHRGDFLQFFNSGKTFSEAYNVGCKIGEGGFGKVFEAQHKVMGVSRAVKRIRKSRAKTELRKNELAALLALDHPHIIKLQEYYDEDDQFLYLVFERCYGPDLLERINRSSSGRLNEFEASVALRHMLKALQCCHSQYRGHYDIKPENFMYAQKDCKDLMMIDLGMSSGFERQRRNRIKGTVEYMAPEFWDGIYGPEGDVWSCGVVLFVMLTGELFLKNVPPEIKKRELKCRGIMRERMREAAEKYKLSAEAQDLLSLMLQHDRHARPTVREALKHRFNQSSYDVERLHPSCVEHFAYKEALAVRERMADTFRAVSREAILKRVARMAMAHAVDVSNQELAAERLVFRMLDRHGYGELSISALENDYTSRKWKVPEDLGQLFEAMDLNRDGYISYQAFLAIMLPFNLRSNQTLCKVTFLMLDQGRDGFIDAADLAVCFGHKKESDTCLNIIAEVCPVEGRMPWERFAQMMTGDVLI